MCDLLIGGCMITGESTLAGKLSTKRKQDRVLVPDTPVNKQVS